MRDNAAVAVRPAGRGRGRKGIVIAVAVIALLAVAYLSISGWEMRKRAWAFFAPVRFEGDIQRNFYFGTLTLRHGWLNLYEDQARIIREAGQIRNRRARQRALNAAMNYSPLRAAVFAWWAAGTGEPQRTPPRQTPQWQENDERDPHFNARLSGFNAALALSGAVAAGLLTYQWSRRPGRRQALPGEVTLWREAWPILAGVIAFACFWYNPAGLVLGHGWPSPNAWVLPFFLWALLLATWEWWFLSGVVIGIGAMAQGQHLLVAPLFLLWPVFALQPMRAVRWLAGFGTAFMGIVSGWMLTMRPDPAAAERVANWPAVWWIAASAVMLALLPAMRWALARLRRRGMGMQPPDDAPESTAPAADPPARPTRRYGWQIATAVVLLAAGAVLSWPLLPLLSSHALIALGGIFAAVALAGLAWFTGWRTLRYAIPAAAAVQLLLCMPLFGASDAWWLVGFKYGTERHYELAVGTANNLGALLRETYGFRDLDQVVLTVAPIELLGGNPQPAAAGGGGLAAFLHRPVEISMKVLLLAIYGLALLLASLATAIQWRRRDPNFLLAATVPWVLLALLPPQMHERYLGFAALAAAVWIGARGGVGWMLLGGIFSFVAYAQIACCMGRQARGFIGGQSVWHLFLNRDFFRNVETAIPDLSWPLLLGMLMVLFVSFLPARPRRRRPPPPAPQAATASLDEPAPAPAAAPLPEPLPA